MKLKFLNREVDIYTVGDVNINCTPSSIDIKFKDHVSSMAFKQAPIFEALCGNKVLYKDVENEIHYYFFCLKHKETNEIIYLNKLPFDILTYRILYSVGMSKANGTISISIEKESQFKIEF